MTTTRVTIGLPVYNGERFLRNAIESILGQTYEDWALVISDNASSDRTVPIVEAFAARDDRIALIRNDVNRGAAWNYNRVLSECRTPYFKWAAADDMLAPTALERLVATLDSAPPSVVLAYPRTQMVDETGRVIDEVDDDLASQPGTPPHTRFKHVVLRVAWGNCIFALVRTDALRRTRMHGSFPAADYVLLSELALAGEFRYVPEPLFLRRLHEGISGRANTTNAQLTRWFDPNRQTVHNPTFTLLREYFRGVRHAQLSGRERASAYLEVAPAWLRRHVGIRSRLPSLFGRSETGG